LNSVEQDGVPGVTQCPIPPGESYIYEFQVTQYGSSWYHSHFSLQYADGLYGPLIFNGPATADYDEDLGVLFIGDWSHVGIDDLWLTARQVVVPSMENGLINGTNTYDCTGSTDANCLRNGTKFEMTFDSGLTYRLRVIHEATEGHLEFSVDGHSFTVIATGFVPIVPYETDSVLISIGQRYDLLINANQTSTSSGDYWIRSGWQTGCAANQNADNITGILRYNSSSTADPTTAGITPSTDCGDEPLASLIPWLSLNVTNIPAIITEDFSFSFGDYFTWIINSISFYTNWSDPTLLDIIEGASIFPTDYNIIDVEVCAIWPTSNVEYN
jgi:FtsP/CotA-like multicopper oxidase with cupredoxin domain